MFGRRLINTGGAVCPSDVTDLFEDGSGVALYRLNSNADDSSGNYDGTATNVTYVSGHIDNAGSFNGSSSFISVPYNVGGDMSISGWVKFDVNSTDEPIFNLDNLSGSGTRAFQIKRRDTNELYVYFFTGNDFVSPTSLTSGVWYHIAVTFESNAALKIYVNGILEGQVTNVTTRPTQPNVFLGKFGDGSITGVLDGDLDQVRIFDRAITAAEVTTLYNEVAC